MMPVQGVCFDSLWGVRSNGFMMIQWILDHNERRVEDPVVRGFRVSGVVTIGRRGWVCTVIETGVSASSGRRGIMFVRRLGVGR